MVVHLTIALAFIVVVAIPIVVVAAGLIARVEMCIVSILIAGTEGEVVANGVAETQTELPRRVELELIGLAIVDTGTHVVLYSCVVAGLHVIPGGRSN